VEEERLTASSDGVIAAIVTIPVLDLKAPTGALLAALAPVLPSSAVSFLAYGERSEQPPIAAEQRHERRLQWYVTP